MANPKKYRCLNVGNCSKADKKEVFTIQEGEDLKCPECHEEMLQEVKGGGLPVWLLALIGVAVVVIAAIVFWPKGGEKADNPDPYGIEVTDDEIDNTADDEVGDDESEEPEDDATAGPDTVIVNKTDTVVQVRVDTVKVEKNVVVDNTLRNYNLGWGLYTGQGRSGKPDGIGTIKVTASHAIDLKTGGKTIEVNNGDQIVNAKFEEGRLVSGNVKFANGTVKYFNIGV